MSNTTTQIESERMQCLEVWGGNQAVERCFLVPGLRVSIYSKPYGEADGGGDVYYLSSCASGRITRMLLADVSGHGEAVSSVAIGLRDLMRKNVNFVRQTRFVKAMNQQFADLAKQGGFATSLVCTYFAPTRTLALCNAGHPVPLLHRQSASQWVELEHDAPDVNEPADLPFGVLDDTQYFQQNVQLDAGDLFLGYSDAVTESLDANGEMLGQAGVLQLVNELDASEPAGVVPELIERIRQMNPSNLRQDDASLLLCQATEDGVSLKDNLLAPLRLLRRVRVSEHRR